MDVKLEWDNPEKTMIRFAIAGSWSWESFDAALDELTAMFDSANRPVAVLLYPADGVRIKMPPDTPTRFLHILRTRMKRQNYLILVRTMPYGKVLYNVFAKLMPSIVGRVSFVNSLEEARRVAAEKLAAHEKEMKGI